MLYPGDIVVVRSGRPGDAAVIPEDFEKLNCIDLIIAKPGPDLLSHYLVAVLNSSFGKRQFHKGIAGTAQKHFNVGAFKKLQIPIPPLKEQEDFVEEFNSLSSSHKSIINRTESNQKLYRNSLEKLFSM